MHLSRIAKSRFAIQSALGINGLSPSTIIGPSIPQTLFSTLDPTGIVGPSQLSCTYGPGAGTLPAYSNAEVFVNVSPTHYVAGTVQLINCSLSWNKRGLFVHNLFGLDANATVILQADVRNQSRPWFGCQNSS